MGFIVQKKLKFIEKEAKRNHGGKVKSYGAISRFDEKNSRKNENLSRVVGRSNGEKRRSNINKKRR